MSARASWVLELSIFQAVCSTNSRNISICMYDSAMACLTVWNSAMSCPRECREITRSHIMSSASFTWATARMAWWIRPPPRRNWATWRAPPSGPSRLAAGTRTLLYRMWAWMPAPARNSRPGVPCSTMNMPLLHMTMMMSADLPKLENHFSPLMTHSSPSRTAWVLKLRMSAPPSGSVIE